MQRLRETFTHFFNENTISIWFIGISIVLTTSLVLLNLDDTLTADDYQFYGWILHQNVFQSLTHYGTDLTGRYGHAFILIFFIKLFKLKALWIAPLISLLVLMIATTYSGYVILKAYIPYAKTMVLICIIPFVILTCIITTPSLFDTYVWFSSSTLYITSGAILAVVGSLFAKSLVKEKIPLWIYISASFLLLLSAGFYEVIPVELVLVGVTGTVLSFTKKDMTRKKVIRSFSLMSLLAGLVGGSIVRFSPWIKGRLQSGIHYTFHQQLGHILLHLNLIPHFIFSWAGFFILVTGGLLYICIGKLRIKTMWSVVIIALGLIFIPLLITATLATLGGLIEANDLASARVLYIGTSGIFIGSSLVVYVLLTFIPKPYIPRSALLASVVIISIIALGYGMSRINEVNQAVNTKKSMFQFREQVIKQDLATHRSSVRIIAAPPLISDSQIDDIGFGSPPTEVWSIMLRKYYHIPQNTPLEFVTEAPAGYCTDISNSAVYGKQTCQQIVTSADILKYATYK